MTNPILFQVNGNEYTRRTPNAFELLGIVALIFSRGRIKSRMARHYYERERKHWAHHTRTIQAELDRQHHPLNEL